jgi:hypothetical protein
LEDEEYSELDDVIAVGSNYVDDHVIPDSTTQTLNNIKPAYYNLDYAPIYSDTTNKIKSNFESDYWQTKLDGLEYTHRLVNTIDVNDGGDLPVTSETTEPSDIVLAMENFVNIEGVETENITEFGSLDINILNASDTDNIEYT